MPANIEIKARARDYELQFARARALSSRPPERIDQTDIFFDVPRGRLKLRKFSSDRGELIYYERADRDGPKRSDYFISPTDGPDQLTETLEKALGRRGAVCKTPTLVLVGNTRIHFDRVEDLGEYIELEVVLADGQTDEEGSRIAHGLMSDLGIEPEDLLEAAYIDLLEAK